MIELSFEEVLDLFPAEGANLAGLWQKAPRAGADAPAWSCVVKVGGWPPTGSGAGAGATPAAALAVGLANAIADAHSRPPIRGRLSAPGSVIVAPPGVTSALLDE